jgi:hypothetical protein
MQVEECDISRNFKPSPNGGAAMAKGHFELVDGVCVSFPLLYGRNHPAMKIRELPQCQSTLPDWFSPTSSTSEESLFPCMHHKIAVDGKIENSHQALSGCEFDQAA